MTRSTAVLPPNDFVVAPPCAFAHHPQPAAALNVQPSPEIVASSRARRRQTPRAAIGRLGRAVLRRKRARRLPTGDRDESYRSRHLESPRRRENSRCRRLRTASRTPGRQRIADVTRQSVPAARGPRRARSPRSCLARTSSHDHRTTPPIRRPRRARARRFAHDRGWRACP